MGRSSQDPAIKTSDLHIIRPLDSAYEGLASKGLSTEASHILPLRPSNIAPVAGASSKGRQVPERHAAIAEPEPESVPREPHQTSNAEASTSAPSTTTTTTTTTTAPTEGYAPGFISRRLLCFVGIVLGYTGLYLTRGSLTYAAPVMVADKTLGVTLTDIGAMASAFPLAYGLSKFTGGVLGAKFSNRLMLGLGLTVTAVINLAFGASSAVTAFTALWFMNGMLQGIGAPASASLLTRWFASKERGTYWGLWNIGANVGGFLTPIIVGTMAKHYGWQWGMWTPGLMGLALGLFALEVVKDSPEQAGFPPVEASPAGATAKDTMSIGAALAQVVKTPAIWLLAFTYFFVYIVRQGATSWLIFYLMQAKGATDAAQAAMTVSGLELGGLVGGTLAGLLSDARIRAAAPATADGSSKEVGHVGRRVQIVMGYIATTMVVLAGLKMVPATSGVLQWLCIAALGFTIYGPHMLIGLCGAELVAKPAVGASQGLLGLVAYMGAANAGIPLSWVVQNHGWDGYFMTMTAACVVALLLLAPLANAPSFLQIQKREEKKLA